MNSFDPESSQMIELFACYGYAMYKAQCLEQTLAIAMTTVYGPGIKKIKGTKYDYLLESNFHKTFGELTGRIGKSTPVPKEFKSMLLKAVKKRNRLTHKYFWEKSVEFTAEDGRQSMIKELKEMAHLFSDIDLSLTVIMRQWGEKHGVTKEVIEREMERLKEDKKWDS